MAELSTLARPYAKAAFMFANEAGKLSEWSNALTTLARIAAHEKVIALITSPTLSGEDQANAIVELANGELLPEVENFTRLLGENKRLLLLEEIAAQFDHFKAEQERCVDVEVTSAYDLDDAATEELATALKRSLQRDVRVSTHTDKSLIGGVVVKAGDTVIDGSLKGRLTKLAEAMYS